jgi:glyoxylase-like metal-dependent hydrolase (beta-lactamase superfamily II)
MEFFDQTVEIEKDLIYVDTLAHDMKKSIGILFYRNENQSIIFDSGMPNSDEQILYYLKKFKIDFRSVSHILLTHRHIDHAGASAKILEKLPNAIIGLHPYSIKHLAEPSKIFEGGKELFQEYATPMKKTDESLIKGLTDNEKIYAGQEEIEVIYSPGHTSDHISYYIPSRKMIYAGDAIGSFNAGTGRVYPTSIFPSFDYQKYKQTMKIFHSLDFDKIVFSHFGIAMGPDVKKILDYSLNTYSKLEEIVHKYDNKNNKEGLIDELKNSLLEATEIFPKSVRMRASEFMAKGFIKGMESS